MSDDLVEAKLQAEIEKLRAETASMRRPFAKPLNWIPFLFGTAGLVSAVGQWQVSTLRQQRVALNAERVVFEKAKELADVQEAMATAEARASDLDTKVSARIAQLNKLDAMISQQNSRLDEIARRADSASIDELRKTLKETSQILRVIHSYSSMAARG